MADNSDMLDFDLFDESSIMKSDEINILAGPTSDKSSTEKDKPSEKDKKKKLNGTRKKRMKKQDYLSFPNILFFPEKSSLSREEKKNLQAMRLFAKMEQGGSRKQDDFVRKKRKLNVDASSDLSINSGDPNPQLEVEKSVESKENGNVTSGESTLPPIVKTNSKKVEPKLFSVYLNPNFDMKNHNSLIRFIYDYQREQLNKIKNPKENGQEVKGVNGNGSGLDGHSIAGEQNEIAGKTTTGGSLLLRKLEKSKMEIFRNSCRTTSEKFQVYLKGLPENQRMDISQILNKFTMDSP